MLRTSIAFSAALALAAPPVLAQGKDDLWEVQTQMSMPGMPAGMPGMAQTHQICADKDPKKAATQRPDTEKCKVGDYKQSGNRVTMTIDCPEGKAEIEQTFNAARTEYKQMMKMKTRDGDMTMNSTGRRVGSCDAQQARKKQDQQIAAIQQQSDAAMAQSQAQMAKLESDQIKQCTAALDGMRAQGFGVFAQCSTQKGSCDAMAQTAPKAAKACTANTAEYCKRYGTMEGFLKAKGDENGARMCGVSRQQVAASHCPRAQKTENLAYLGRYCLAEAKPLAEQHCVGRGYTSQARDKYSDFCSAYLAQAGIEQPAAAAQPEAKKDAKSKVTEGVSQGINKLKGLFGR
jgi:hypothetical protein